MYGKKNVRKRCYPALFTKSSASICPLDQLAGHLATITKHRLDYCSSLLTDENKEQVALPYPIVYSFWFTENNKSWTFRNAHSLAV